MKLYIIANRLPVKVSSDNGSFLFTRSEGGLATGLNSLDTTFEKHWIGWPGICLKKKTQQQDICNRLESMNLHPVFLTQSQYNYYYEGYSNSTLWPLCHYFFDKSKYRKNYWTAYQEVNRKFATAVCDQAEPDSMVWVQDYQLLLVPGMLREMRPDLRIGFFMHIPFPSYELFRVLPEHAILLKGMLGADFIAFHTHDYLRHFISASERSLGLEFKLDEVMVGGRAVHIDALPMGVNYDLYHQAGQHIEVRQAIGKMQQLVGNHQLILSVDRLDYSKGILHRLVGYAAFLDNNPSAIGKVTLVMVVVPSRDKVEKYAELKRQIDEKIGSINGKYSHLGWTPVCYFYRALPFEELSALYKMSDIALVTPLRDGMNLVAKEYIASKQISHPGILILSRMAGAAAELTEALLINPNDTTQIAGALEQAIAMPKEERQRRLAALQDTVSTQTVYKWAADFINEWSEAVSRNIEIKAKVMGRERQDNIALRYQQSKHRLIVLDYDGTLVGLRNDPQKSIPTEELKALLAKLSEDSRNHIVVNSGRDHQTLEKWLGDINLDIVAEHGAFYKSDNHWTEYSTRVEWSDRLVDVLKAFVKKTPNSRLEIKDTALAWHYREVDAWLGTFRAQQLARTLYRACSKMGLQVIPGNKVLEIKSSGYNKGTIIKKLISQHDYDFTMAIGDDTTDEDMFLALPPDGFSIRVGICSTNARFLLSETGDVLPFLDALTERRAHV
ncbi:MAG: bifunctional alpha,alpha-trehalose-phosphate synthase (UDP-forming)/trehalose-phosphatase [Prevotella sp.]|nr:bifunctional alpha,alpha-trehalose-phosphate synthase (UDP-forming)/trehalose-phosphatase [Prevotella sp.]